MSRITWTQNAYGGEVGHVTIGKTDVKIASISYSVKRNDPKPYVLRSEIPGWKNARHHETADAAKASMDRILRTFATAMLENTEAKSA